MNLKNFLIVLSISVFVIFGMNNVRVQAGANSFWFILVTVLSSTGFPIFIGTCFRLLPILQIKENWNKLAILAGAKWFNRLLKEIGWEKITTSLRPPLKSKQPPLDLLQSFQSNCIAHTWVFFIHLYAIFLANNHLIVIIILFILGYFLHALPSFLQINLMWRSQKLESLRNG